MNIATTNTPPIAPPAAVAAPVTDGVAVTAPPSIFGAMAKSKPAKKGKGGSDKPELTDPALDQLVDDYIANDQAMKDAKTLADQAKDQLIAAGQKTRLQCSLQDGKNHSSVVINGKLTMSTKCQYSAIPQERESELADAFGEEDKERFFKAAVEIKLSEAAAASEGVLAVLQSKLGAAFIESNFVVTRTVGVTEAFHTEYATNQQVRIKAQPFVEDQTIKPYSPSLKVK